MSSLIELPFEERASTGLAIALGSGSSSSGQVSILEDFELFAPDYIYGIYNDAYSRNLVQGLYIENILRIGVDVYINNKLNVLYLHNRNVASIDTVQKSYTVSGYGYSVKSLTLNLISAKASRMVNKKALCLHFGDSITANELVDVYGNQLEYWNYPSKIYANILRDQVDQAAIGNTIPTPVCLGHSNPKTRNFTYRGQSLTVRGGDAGIGSWCAANFLRHAMHLTSGTVSSVGTIPGDVSYYLLGLQTTTGATYTGTAAQKELIRTTIQGKTPVNKNATVWNYLKTLSGWGGGSGSYTGSTADNNAIDAFLNAKYLNPDNPFYSLTKAQTSGATNAYSLVTYLSRYKTLADNGIDRLVVGSTAGTKVTNVNAWDVCMPNYMTIELGENDQFWFSPSYIDVCNDLIAFSTVIKSEYPSIKIGYIFNPHPGVLFPNRYEKNIAQIRDSTSNWKSLLDTEIRNRLGTLASQIANNVHYIPTYKTFYPLNSLDDLTGYNASGEVRINGSDLHPGLEAAASIADQVTSWLYIY